MKRLMKASILFGLLLMLVISPLSPYVFASGNSLNKSFQEAAGRYQVPVDVLKAIAYTETRMMDHQGKPSQVNGYGIMHLVENEKVHTLQTAHRLTKIPVDQLKGETSKNILGGAAVLAHIAKSKNNGRIPRVISDWYPVVADYAGYNDLQTRKLFADEVFKFLQTGETIERNQEIIRIQKHTVKLNNSENSRSASFTTTATPDYPSARWVPASSSNYSVRDSRTINYIVIHVTQGSYSGSISWFQNPQAQTSAHYVIRSSDGQVTQMVQNKDIAWHAGNWDYNTKSIGIEHEGYVSDPAWFTDTMYRSSANLTKWLGQKYNIPLDRSHIIGHNQVPGATHTDPGTHWDWSYYMELVNGGQSTIWKGPYTVQTDSGLPLNVRSQPSTSATIVDQVADGGKVYMSCYKKGTTVTGKYGTSDVWDYVKTPNGKYGYISDTYIYTGSDNPVVPLCTQ